MVSTTTAYCLDRSLTIRHHSAPDATEVFIDRETRIQILQTISELARAIKGQGAAFVVRSARFSSSSFAEFLLSAMNVCS